MNRTIEPYKKLKIASDLFDFAYRVKRFQLTQKHPDYSSEQIHLETLKLIEKACQR